MPMVRFETPEVRKIPEVPPRVLTKNFVGKTAKPESPSAKESWEQSRVKYMKQLYKSKRTTTLFYEIRDTDKFLGGSLPVGVKADLEDRKPITVQERRVDRGFRISELKRYFAGSWKSELGKYNSLGFKDPVLSFNEEVRILQLPGEDGKFNPQSFSCDSSRIDWEVALNIDPVDVAMVIQVLEYYSIAKLGPVLVLAGMGGGKTAIAIQLINSWPGQTHCFSFHDSEQIVSRNGSRKPCKQIERWTDIPVASLKHGGAKFPDAIIVDEFQFGDTESFESFYQVCREFNFKLIVLGLCYNLENRLWEMVEQFLARSNRQVFRLTMRCEVCREASTEMTAQLRDNPVSRQIESLKPKRQWVTVCRFCAFRYFNHCFVTVVPTVGVSDSGC